MGDGLKGVTRNMLKERDTGDLSVDETILYVDGVEWELRVNRLSMSRIYG